MQITVDSLLGNHGPYPKRAGEALLKEYPEAVLASDAHGMYRCSGLSPGYARVRELFGPEREDDLRARADRVLTRLRATA
jgi:hypothetical protein